MTRKYARQTKCEDSRSMTQGTTAFRFEMNNRERKLARPRGIQSPYLTECLT